MSSSLIKHTISQEEVLTWRSFLSHFPLEFIHQQIENYKDCCLNYSSNDGVIGKAIDSLFQINYKDHLFSPPFSDLCSFKDGDPMSKYFFRVRKIDGMSLWEEESFDLNSFELREIQSQQDVWECPARDVKFYGRLNAPNTSVLYTALEPSTAIQETIITQCDKQKIPPFILIAYKRICNLNYSDCFHFVNYGGLTDEENTKRYLLFTLLRNEFTRIRPMLYDDQNQYCASYHISKKFFINKSSEAIYYPSTRGLGKGNFAFWGDFRKYLEFVGFFFYIDGRPYLGCSWDNEKGKFDYFSLNSDKAKQVFGDPILQIQLQK
jgi:hypothetical protein